MNNVVIRNGDNTVEGLTTDAAVVTDANGTLSGKLRGLVKIFADVWDSVNHVLKVSGTVTAAPTRGAVTDRSGTIAVGGTSQQLAAANASRNYLLIQNQSAGTLWFNFTTAAVEGQPSVQLLPNDSYEMFTFVSTEAINIIGATGGQAYTAKEN